MNLHNAINIIIKRNSLIRKWFRWKKEGLKGKDSTTFLFSTNEHWNRTVRFPHKLLYFLRSWRGQQYLPYLEISKNSINWKYKFFIEIYLTKIVSKDNPVANIFLRFFYYVKNFFAIIHSVKLPCWLLYFHSIYTAIFFPSSMHILHLWKFYACSHIFFSFFLSRGWEGWKLFNNNNKIASCLNIHDLIFCLFCIHFVSRLNFFLFASQSFWEVQRIFSAISFLLFLEIFSCFWLIKYRWHLEIWLIHVIHLDL